MWLANFLLTTLAFLPHGEDYLTRRLSDAKSF
jgi:hypothetical protein